MPAITHIPAGWEEVSALAQQRLPQLAEALKRQFHATAYMGCELEWYVAPSDDASSDAHHAAATMDIRIIDALHAEAGCRAREQGIALTAIKPETGQGQYEVGFDVTADPLQLAQDIDRFRQILMQCAKAHSAQILWEAKPYAHDYGSSLQVHIHLEDAAGQRLFEKRDTQLSAPLAAAIGGLLAITPAATRVAAPTALSYDRFTPKCDAPVNVCWGGNNRSVTLRLPLKTGPQCHIEYRLAGADADAASMVAIMLTGVLHGLTHRPDCGEQIYGVASDSHYILPALPRSLPQAEREFSESSVLLHWLGAEWQQAVIRCK